MEKLNKLARYRPQIAYTMYSNVVIHDITFTLEEDYSVDIIAEFHDVFSDERKTLRPITCIPAEINVVPDAMPIRISTARRLDYAF